MACYQIVSISLPNLLLRDVIRENAPREIVSEIAGREPFDSDFEEQRVNIGSFVEVWRSVSQVRDPAPRAADGYALLPAASRSTYSDGAGFLGDGVRLYQEDNSAWKHEPWLTMVAIMDDGADLSRAITDLKGLGMADEDLTVILKRPDPDEPEPFPEGTRYIVVPDDSRGLELAVGFAGVFVVSGLLFAFTTPRLGLVLFMFFITLAALLAAACFVKVGVMPILIDVEAPAEESGLWNDEFEKGRILLFASTSDGRILKPAREIFEEQGAYYDIVGRRLEPRPVSGAVMRLAKTERLTDRPGEVQQRS